MDVPFVLDALSLILFFIVIFFYLAVFLSEEESCLALQSENLFSKSG